MEYIGKGYAYSSGVFDYNTAAENNIKNVRFKIGKVENKLPEILKNTKMDGIIFDPPRKGIDENTLKSIGKHGIERIVYISCNPSTLARDVKILTDLGYRLEKLAAVDMFPQTHHIEAVALLSKLK